MKAFAVIFAVVSMAQAAQADGFRCLTNDGELAVKVYNHTDASVGTRSAAIMVVSDPNIQVGRKTIATFSSVNERLSQSGASYVADVDLRFADSNRKGEKVGPTKLGQIDQIMLDVDHNYLQPVEAGTELEATLTIVKRNGTQVELAATCERYLKN